METAPVCPRDQSTLLPLQGAAQGASCGACGGMHLRDAAIQAAFAANGVALAKTRSLFELPAPLPCPSCRVPMQGLMMAGIEVDLCEACAAVWLDPGELEKANAYLQADLPRRHPKSQASAEDFGVLGGLVDVPDAGDLVWDRNKDAEIVRELWDVLKRVFGR